MATIPAIGSATGTATVRNQHEHYPLQRTMKPHASGQEDYALGSARHAQKIAMATTPLPFSQAYRGGTR